MEELNKYPDFNNYLVFVLTKLTSEGKSWYFIFNPQNEHKYILIFCLL